MVKNLAGEMVWTNEYRPSGKYAAILPSFEIEGTYPEDGKRNLVLTLTSDLVKNFDIETLIGTDYDYVGSGVYVFNGQEVPEFQNNLIVRTSL